MKNFLQDFICADKISHEFMLMFSIGHFHHMFKSWTCPEDFENAISKISSTNLRYSGEQHFVIDQKFSSKLINGFQNLSKILDDILIRTSPEYVHCWLPEQVQKSWELKFQKFLQQTLDILKNNFLIMMNDFLQDSRFADKISQEFMMIFSLKHVQQMFCVCPMSRSLELKFQKCLQPTWETWWTTLIQSRKILSKT